jgi:hypothetical protein
MALTMFSHCPPGRKQFTDEQPLRDAQSTSSKQPASLAQSAMCVAQARHWQR